MRLPRTTLLLIFVLARARAASTDWEISPVDDQRVPMGKISVVGGEIGAEPINFVLKNLAITQPIRVTLVAIDEGKPVELFIYKDDASKAPAGTATRDKELTFKFRTAEQVYFSIKGADGAHYQLLTWVGPEFEIEASSPVYPVSEYPSSIPLVEARNTSPAPAPSSEKPGARVIELSTGTTILLSSILVALIAIAVILFFRRGSKGVAGVILVAGLVHESYAAEKGVPGKVTPKEEAPKVKKSITEVYDALDKIIKGASGPDFDGGTYKPKSREPGLIFVTDKSKDTTYTVKTEKEVDTSKPGEFKYKKFAGDAAAMLKFTLGLLEEFGFIDPREAAIQKNMTPPGMPLLPSRCAKDPECGPCFKKANKDLMEARDLMETQYVIYKQTELHAGRIIELGDGAAGMSSIAKLVWDMEKNAGSVAKLKGEFYDKYDGNLAKLLNNLNGALIAQAQCERNAYQDQDWYNRWGSIYYTFMRDRYTRK